MNNLNAKTLELLTETAKCEKRTMLAMKKAIDAVQAEGKTSLHFTSPTKPESLCTQEQWDELKVAVRKSFTKDEQRILSYSKADAAKSLNDKQKDVRRHLIQVTGQQIGKWKQALTRREEAGREPVISTIESRTHTKIKSILTALEKTEQFDGNLLALYEILTSALEEINIESPEPSEPSH